MYKKEPNIVMTFGWSQEDVVTSVRIHEGRKKEYRRYLSFRLHFLVLISRTSSMESQQKLSITHHQMVEGEEAKFFRNALEKKSELFFVES